MGNIVTLVLSYRLNKEHKEELKQENEEELKKENICIYLYGKCNIKNVRDHFTTDPLL
jgi:regulatory protein YycI of two-component signal transduction system YycFG